MQTQLILLVGLAVILAGVLHPAPGRMKPAWLQPLNGWQPVFGLVAFLLVVLVMLNPEFLALGLLGDTAFFDMLVLALTLQMHLSVVRACRRCVTGLTKVVRYVAIPSPGLRYLLGSSTLLIGSLVTFIQKVVHRP